MTEKHTIMGGKVHVYKRENSTVWQCSSYMEGRNRRVSTKETSLAKAKEFAEDWYLELHGKKARGELLNEMTFEQAADRFMKEYEVMTAGERNKVYVKGHKARLKNHLLPYFGKMGISQVTSGVVQDYRIFRLQNDPKYKAPARSTMHQEIVTLRQVLKTAIRHGWLSGLPDLSVAYRASSKVSHRAWFSPEEYKRLYTATRQNIKDAKNSYHRAMAAQLHDKVLFMANTGIRPDEANCLEYRDVRVVEDEATNETILEIEVRGKRGVGYCMSMPGAVRPFERMKERNDPASTDKLFPVDHKKQFNRILENEELKFDRDGNRRTLYSLRHSYISFRLLEGADIYQIAKNCRTSVEMIEKHYAVHLKNQIDTAAVNVRK
ncbi:MAG: site-specific integrase [Pseudomonadota bacterium]